MRVHLRGAVEAEVSHGDPRQPEALRVSDLRTAVELAVGRAQAHPCQSPERAARSDGAAGAGGAGDARRVPAESAVEQGQPPAPDAAPTAPGPRSPAAGPQSPRRLRGREGGEAGEGVQRPLPAIQVLRVRPAVELEVGHEQAHPERAPGRHARDAVGGGRDGDAARGGAVPHGREGDARRRGRGGGGGDGWRRRRPAARRDALPAVQVLALWPSLQLEVGHEEAHPRVSRRGARARADASAGARALPAQRPRHADRRARQAVRLPLLHVPVEPAQQHQAPPPPDSSAGRAGAGRTARRAPAAVPAAPAAPAASAAAPWGREAVAVPTVRLRRPQQERRRAALPRRAPRLDGVHVPAVRRRVQLPQLGLPAHPQEAPARRLRRDHRRDGDPRPADRDPVDHGPAGPRRRAGRRRGPGRGRDHGRDRGRRREGVPVRRMRRQLGVQVCNRAAPTRRARTDRGAIWRREGAPPDGGERPASAQVRHLSVQHQQAGTAEATLLLPQVRPAADEAVRHCVRHPNLMVIVHV